MTNGVLIFAHNSRDVDYALMATIAGRLAKHHLAVPVTLVSDQSTIEWFKSTDHYAIALDTFDSILIVEKPNTGNNRKLRDGTTYKTVPFVNANRSSVYDLTPYDNTLLIDSDYLIFSNKLAQYWNLDYDVMIGHSMNDLVGNRSEILDNRVSEVGPHMYWATTVMFKKNKNSELFFNLVSYIRENYDYYADLYRFDSRQYRNDIAFSVAKHILDAFQSHTQGSLPSIPTAFDSDILFEVSDAGLLKFLVSDRHNPQKFSLVSTKDVDVHILNKQSIIRHSKRLLGLA